MNPYQKFLKEIKLSIATKQIYTDDLRRFAYGTDASFYRLTPQIIIKAKTEDDVKNIIIVANRHQLSITFRAAGTGLSGQSITDSILVLTGHGWENYEILENGDAIKTQPGIIGSRLNEILRPYHVKIGPDPASVNSAMIGGIVANNASGMNGTNENSYKTIRSIRIILADGTMLDTGSHISREQFLNTHQDFIAKIIDIRNRISANAEIKNRIQRKYKIKNTTGLNINAFTDFTDPFDIITHLLVGSEGTLGFISEVILNTLPLKNYKASAMLYFKNIIDACKAVQVLKSKPVDSAELLDRPALRAIENNDGIPDFIKTLPHGVTAVLIETKTDNPEILASNIDEIKNAIKNFEVLYPIIFTDNPDEYSKYWKIRSGVFPSVGAMRPVGTACLIEDVVFPLDVLPEATEELQQLLMNHGYHDGVIYGHAIEGNFHFIIHQNFDNQEDVNKFGRLIDSVAKMVVEKYDGSLKGEHGTGRNLAPYVKYEWGAAIYELMVEIKQLFDPTNILNRNVIFNDNLQCHLENLKKMPAISQHVDQCIECGFCEVNCLSCGFTLSARQRIATQREIKKLKNTQENPNYLKQLIRNYKYYGEQTCAKDGLCAMSCPVNIDTGKLTEEIRRNQTSTINKKVAHYTAHHFAGVKKILRFLLRIATLNHVILGTTIMRFFTKSIHKISNKRIPLWTTAMPKSMTVNKSKISTFKSTLKIVYFPSCINQTMGTARDDTFQEPLYQVTCKLLMKAGYEIIFPKKMDTLCCGTIWESKGFTEEATFKVQELQAALIEASENGKYPIICDQSPCLYTILQKIKTLKIYDPLEFIGEQLTDTLIFTPQKEPIALHITCSMKKMGKEEIIKKIANLCSHHVFIPTEVGCCGFAGDRGFFYPKLNTFALRKLRKQLTKNNIKYGYSNSRTCEIGLTTNARISYQSLLYLVDKCTQSIKEIGQ